MACRDAVENLIESGLIRLGDQTAPKVLLQGLMRACCSFPQDPVGAFRDVFDLHAGHGAILALLAPKCKRDFAPALPWLSTVSGGVA
jgi:hypothetical protein